MNLCPSMEQVVWILIENATQRAEKSFTGEQQNSCHGRDKVEALWWGSLATRRKIVHCEQACKGVRDKLKIQTNIGRGDKKI